MHRHLQLLGLDAEEASASLATCVRELFENALDAVSGGGGALGHISVQCAEDLDEAEAGGGRGGATLSLIHI